MNPIDIKTYPEMNETIKDLLRLREEPMGLYILARIEELEKQVRDLTPPQSGGGNGMTNLEKIRSLSAEELADFLDKVKDYPCTACCNNFHWCRRNNAPEPVCKRHFLDWLKEEAIRTREEAEAAREKEEDDKSQLGHCGKPDGCFSPANMID